MKKNILALTVIVILFGMAFMPIGTSINIEPEEKIVTTGDPKIEETFLVTWIYMNLKDSTFKFGSLSPGTYKNISHDRTYIKGLFFNVKITGTIIDNTSLYFLPMIGRNIPIIRWILKGKTQQDLGIEIGDRVEISAPIFTTRAPAGTTWGTIDEYGKLSLDGVVFSLTLKVYD